MNGGTTTLPLLELLLRLGVNADVGDAGSTTREDIVVEDDLVKALNEELFMGAGLDVYDAEPKVNEGLLKLKNVFLLPHLGSATIETREAMGMRVYENIKAFFQDKEPRDRVV